MEIYNECKNWRLKCINTFFTEKILSFNCEMKSKKGSKYTKAVEVNVLINPNDKTISCDCSEVVMEEWEGKYITVDGSVFVDMKGDKAILKMWAKDIKLIDNVKN